jgi:hypothetical protein
MTDVSKELLPCPTCGKASNEFCSDVFHFPEYRARTPAPADVVDKLAYLEAEARRFAGFYPESSDGRNTFVIFADKIAALAQSDSGDTQ